MTFYYINITQVPAHKGGNSYTIREKQLIKSINRSYPFIYTILFFMFVNILHISSIAQIQDYALIIDNKTST